MHVNASGVRRGSICFFVWLGISLPLAAQSQVLEQLIGAAIATHPELQGQRALLESAESGVAAARWQFFPTPSVTAEAASADASDRLYQGDSRVMTMRVQQPLWTGGRLSAGLAKAEAGVSLGQAALEEARQQLGLRVVQAYGDWQAAQLKTLAIDRSQATHLLLREQVKRRIAEGASAPSDLTLAVARLESIVADAEAARAQRDIALARLGQLLGRRVEGAVLLGSPAQPHAVIESTQTLVDQALAISPSLKKAQAQARVQEAGIAERRADVSPEVYARIERQYGSYVFPDGPPQNRVFVGLSTRFGAGLSLADGIEAARAQHRAALAEVEVQSRTVSEQVMTDQALALSSALRISALTQSLRAAADVAQSYDRQFLAGRKSWLDVMNAARELSQTETQLADLQSTELVASWRLAIYTGGLAAVTAHHPQIPDITR